MPATSNSVIPPDVAVLYQSSDVIVTLSSTGPNGGRYLLNPGSEQMQFLDYNTATPVNGLVPAVILPSGPLIGDTQFTVAPGSSAAFELVSTNWFLFSESGRWAASRPAPPAVLSI